MLDSVIRSVCLNEKYMFTCLELADGERNVDLYHWSSAKFSSTWYDTLSVLVAKGRAQVGVAASNGDWSKRIRDMQYMYIESTSSTQIMKITRDGLVVT